VSPGASLPHQPVSGPPAGEGSGRRRAVTQADRWSRARWWVRRGHHPACGAVVVAPGSGSRVAGVVRWRQRACRGAAWRPQHREHGCSVVGGTASCTSACRRLLSGGGACCWVRWRRSAQQAALCLSSTRHVAGGHHAAGRSCRARWGSHPPPLCLVRRQLPSPTATGWCGIRRPGWYPRGGRRSVTGKPGPLRRCPATQQGLAGDGE